MIRQTTVLTRRPAPIPGGTKAPSPKPEDSEARKPLREHNIEHLGCGAEAEVPLVPKAMDQEIHELLTQVQAGQMPHERAEETWVNGLQRLLPKAKTADEMRLLFDVIQAGDRLLQRYPRLLLALADHGVLQARHDPALVQKITDCCLLHATQQHDPVPLWHAVTACVDELPLASLSGMAWGMAPHLSKMPVEAQHSYFKLSRALNQKEALEERQNLLPSDEDTPQPTPFDDDENASYSSEQDQADAAFSVGQQMDSLEAKNRAITSIEFQRRSTPQPAQEPPTQQAVQTPITADKMRHAQLIQQAMRLFGQLDDDEVRSAQQWDAFLPQINKELLQISPDLRNELVKQMLKSPQATLDQVDTVARLCLSLDASTYQTGHAWRSFSLAILGGGLPLPVAQKLMDCMNAANHPCPPDLTITFKQAQVSLAQQFEQAKV